MGFGDDLMITAHASQIKKKYPERQIVIGSVAKKQAYHSVIYENNPNISDCRDLDLKQPIHVIDYHPGNRPYIDYAKSTSSRYVWNKKYKPIPGEIYFSTKEINDAKKIINDAKVYWKKNNIKKYKNIIFIESSSTKLNDKQFSIKHKNKDWGYNNWTKLINKIKENNLVLHSSHNQTKSIEAIFSTGKTSFRLACAILSLCDMYVGPEGGFGHVAAALRKKAVLYFGGWIDPDVIGYDFHENIYFKNAKSPCGEYKNICQHCEEARKKITVEIILKKINNLLKN